MNETWAVELIPQNGVGWRTDDTGPRTLYRSRGEALGWAMKLAALHVNVRLRHTTVEYETVMTPEQAQEFYAGPANQVPAGPPLTRHRGDPNG